MKKLGTVIIGSGFGDCGKGLITDFETRRQGSRLVVRFNGGGQAGHTVVDGSKRHVFGNISAGTFAGADTYLSSKYIVNPLVMASELDALDTDATIMVHKDARVSTIYDMVLNSVAEIARGADRHGSCGLGINETVTRHEAGFTLTADDVKTYDTSRLANRLEYIRTHRVPARLKVLIGKDSISGDDRFSKYVEFLEAPTTRHAISLKAAAESFRIGVPVPGAPVILEGAQGLMLDEYLGTFPHVTRSITGLPYALQAASELGLKSIQPVYVTRSYSTRHGAGELQFEGVPFGGTPIDETNVEGQWQGKLRFAPLNLKELRKFIDADLMRGQAVADLFGMKLRAPTLALTCVDQLSDVFAYVDLDGCLQTAKTSLLEAIVSGSLQLPISHVSYGPSAKDVVHKG